MENGWKVCSILPGKWLSVETKNIYPFMKKLGHGAEETLWYNMFSGCHCLIRNLVWMRAFPWLIFIHSLNTHVYESSHRCDNRSYWIQSIFNIMGAYLIAFKRTIFKQASLFLSSSVNPCSDVTMNIIEYDNFFLNVNHNIFVPLLFSFKPSNFPFKQGFLFYFE